ncbi:MAG: hypothetical protein JXO49_00650 [Deltaproteobacteria bacterium]|nr:hypothetical protein [Candidatus Anaeroferrophillus wilburensis]MBN2887834.1 hypothetical protein [Deltaproteobacteria bacterium]
MTLEQSGKVLATILLAALLVASCGCAGKAPLTKISGPVAEHRPLCRVALFPFIDDQQDTERALLAYRIFHHELVRAELFEVETEGDVRTFFMRNRMIPGAILDSLIYEKCANQLGVDAIIVGRITDAGMDGNASKGRNPYLNLHVEIIDVKAKQPLVASFLRREGSDYRKALHFGIVDTMTGLLSRLSREIIADWQHKGVPGC